MYRGEGARLEDVSSFSHPAMYPAWAVQPLTVAWAPQRFAKCEMSASLLANDQVCTAFVHYQITIKVPIVLLCCIPPVPKCTLPSSTASMLLCAQLVRTGHNNACTPVVCLQQPTVGFNLLPG